MTNPPGPGWPPGWGPPTPPGPPRRNRGPLWALLGAVCLLAVVAVVLTLIFTGRHRNLDATTGTTTPAEEAPGAGKAPVPASAIDGLLPDKDTLVADVGDPNLGLVTKSDVLDPGTPVDTDCHGVVSVAATSVYAGSGWTAVRWQRWLSPPEPDAPKLAHAVILSVVTYPRARLARDFYTKQSATWKRCAGRTINARVAEVKDAADEFWSLGEVSDADDVLAVTSVGEGGAGWACRNTEAVRNNVIAQLIVCADPISDTSGQSIIGAITEKIDAAA